MAVRAAAPVLLGLVVLLIQSACGDRDQPSQGRDQSRLDVLERRLDTLEQRLAGVEKDPPGGERLRSDLHALEQRVGAAEAKATQALETAKTAPPPAGRPATTGTTLPPTTGRPAFDPVERRSQLDALMTEYRRKLNDLSTREGSQTPQERMASRRELRNWYIARRRAILAGRPLPD